LQGFPLLLLNDPAAHQELAAQVVVQAAGLLAGPDEGIVQCWDRMKEVLRVASWDIFRRRRWARQQGARQAEAAAARAQRRLLRATTADAFVALSAAAQAAVAAATKAWHDLCSPATEVAATLDHLFGDTSSYYFHQLARSPHPPPVIRRLVCPGPPAAPSAGPADLSTPQGLQQALDYCVSFYSSDSPIGLFRVRSDVEPQAQAALLDVLPRQLPATHAALAEGPDGNSRLCPDDLELALRLSHRGSVPGIDGLPYEFYRAFADQLVPVLCRVFNAAFRDAGDAAPLRSLLTGVICLLPKPRQSGEELCGYRPLTLLNCDVKLLMLVLSNRLQRPLDYLIDITQSAFLRGRDISDNVRYHLGLTARLQELGLPGWLLHSDLTKAYDTADRGWLLQAMRAMGFREAGVVRWCALLMAGTHARVRVNGFLSATFPVSAGIPQGGSLSCQEWAILLEPCTAYLNRLQAGGHIAGFLLPDGTPAPAVCSFADDTKSYVHDPAVDGLAIRAAFVMAAQAGLPEQSVAKTKLLYLRGPVPASLDPETQERHAPTDYLLQAHTAPHRLLGVPFCPDEARCVVAAFAQQPQALRVASAPWLLLRLSALGRSHVAMQCLASKTVYQANFRLPSPPVLAALQTAVNRFVGTPGRVEEASPFPGRLYPKFAVATLPHAAGGLGLPHLKAHVLAMQAKTAWLLFRHTSHPWQALYRHEVACAVSPGPGLPPGYHALVTAPAAVHLPPTSTPLVSTAVAAFRRLGVHRIVPPEGQRLESVLLELTFGNAPDPAWLPVSPAEVTTPAARSWLRLGDVRAAHTQQASLAPDEAGDLALILGRLPQPWRSAVTDPLPQRSEWLALPGATVSPLPLLWGPDPLSGVLGLWELWPSGRLHPLPGPQAVPVGPSRPACVVLRPKDRGAWERADLAFAAAQALLPASARQQPLEPWLVGVWSTMQLDPAVWGITLPSGSSVSMEDICVRDARRLLSHSLLLDSQGSQAGYVRGYAEAQAAWPRAWRLAPLGAADAAPELCGLDGLEARWEQSASRAAHPAGSPERVGWTPPWLALQHRPPPRPSRAERAAARELADVAPPQLRPGYAQVWRRLVDPTLHRPSRITCWHILHGSLGCKAFLAHVRRQASPHQPAPERSSVACDAPGCAGAGVLETLTHAFLTCPEVVPVIDWLTATWEALAQCRVPRSSRVLLADDLEAWPARPGAPGAVRLWTRLRVAVLGAIWRVRCSRDEHRGESFARRAVRLGVQQLLAAIQRDWSRTQGDLRMADGGAFCVDWWRGFDVSQSVSDFEAQWAQPPLLCRVEGEVPAVAGVDQRRLVLMLGLGHPVPLPP
jgi:hypothetical protein